MPKKTYTQINSVTLAAATSSVSFSSIPQNFRDLVLISTFTNSTNADVLIRLNADATSSNYPFLFMRGPSTGGPDSGNGESAIGYSFSGPIIQIHTQIMDYSATDKHKTILSRDGNPANQTVARAMRWINTSSINNLQVNVNAGSFNSGATFTLYGIEA